jgi:thiol-disulfide isomerase/thioredoxin
LVESKTGLKDFMMRGFIIAMASLAFIGGLSQGSPSQPQPVNPSLNVPPPVSPTVLPPVESKPEPNPVKQAVVDPLTGISVDRPTVIMVSAAWCGPCQTFKQGPMPAELVSKGWVFLPIDVTEEQWKHVKVRLYPTFRIYNGARWVQVDGVLTPAKMKSALGTTGPVRQVLQNTFSSSQPVDAMYRPRWQNNDGKSRMRHAVEDHGIDIRGKSESQVLREMDAYHDRFGGGHPVKLASFQSSGCPEGGCPPQRRSFFARR